MRPDRDTALAWEARWSRPAGIAALAAIACFIAAIVVATQGVGTGDGDSEVLRNVDAHRAAQLLSSVLQAIGVGLIAFPLYFLYRAARARSSTMRGELVGLAIAGPLFLGVVAILTGVTTLNAASDFVGDEVPRLMAQGVELSSDRADEVAEDTLTDQSLRGAVAGFGIAGQLAFLVGMFYTALHAMRTGLLTRFWGSMGLALAAVSVFFFQFTLLWFIYLGLLLAGWLPGPKPPAWETGEAMPWPTPGEKAAGEMDDDERGLDDPESLPETGEPSGAPGEVGERRKRKRRD
jgi:hypothetical protein